MQAILKIFMQWVVLPLTRDLAIWIGKKIIEGISLIKNYFKERKRKKELKKRNDKKVQAYEDADNVDDASDSFEQLP